MKKYIGFIILASLVFSVSLATLARAEDSNSGTTTNSNSGKIHPLGDLKDKRIELKNEIKDNREAFRQKMQEERKAFTDKLKTEKENFLSELKTEKEKWKNVKAEMKITFCQKAKEIVTKRFEFAITQLEKLQTKVGEIITKLAADGKDTALATEALDLSKQKLVEAKAKLAEIKGLIPDTCDAVTSDIFEKVKLGARDAKNLLKESREALHQSIKEIKTLKGEDSSIEDNSNSGTQ